MWDGNDLEFQLTHIIRDTDQLEVLGVKLRAIQEQDRKDCEKLLKCSKIGFIECEDGFQLRAESYLAARDVIRKFLPVHVLPEHLCCLLLQSIERHASRPLTDAEIAAKLPHQLWSASKSYQREGIRFIVEHNGRAELADGMGVGKTFQAILFSYLYKQDEGPVLIICPTSLCKNWCKELKTWCRLVSPNFQDNQITILSKEKEVVNLDIKEKNKNAAQSIISAKTLPIELPCVLRNDHYYIVPYSIVQRKDALVALVKQDFQIVIADETHAVKNETAKRSIATQAICATAKRILLLSGTPGVRPLEFFTQFSMVAPAVFPERLKWIPPSGRQFALASRDQTRKKNHLMPFSFVSRWCDPWMETTFGHHKQWNKNGTSRADELRAIAREFVFIRRNTEVVLEDELPPKTVKYLHMDITDDDSEKIALTMDKMNKAAAEHQDYERKQCWMEMFRDLPRIKADFVRNHIRTTILNDRIQHHKTIIFAHHTRMIEVIEHELQTQLKLYEQDKQKHKRKRKQEQKETYGGNDRNGKSKRRKLTESKEHKEEKEDKEQAKSKEPKSNPQQTYIKIVGDTPPDSRQSLVDYFQNNEQCRVAVLSLTAAGVGLNLFKASLVIMTEMYFTPGALAQAVARAHRLGCTKPVTVEYLIANGTLDQAIVNIVSKKTVVSSRVLDGIKEEENDEKENKEDADVREESAQVLATLLNERKRKS